MRYELQYVLHPRCRLSRSSNNCSARASCHVVIVGPAVAIVGIVESDFEANAADTTLEGAHERWTAVYGSDAIAAARMKQASSHGAMR